VIELLYQYYTTNSIPDIVRSINNKSQFMKEENVEEIKDGSEQVDGGEAEDYVHLEPMVHYLTQDFEIMAAPLHVVKRMNT